MSIHVVIAVSMLTGYALGATRQWRRDLVARAWSPWRWWR